MIPYTIVRKRNCKHIKIRVKEGEVIVSSPLLVPVSTINRFVQDNEKWILKQLQNDDTSHLKSGDTIRILQDEYSIQKGMKPSVHDYCITVRNQKDFERITVALSKQILEPIAQDIIQKVGLKNIVVQYGTFTSKWGSYHKQKNMIKLNSYLIYTSYAFCVSVILHECAHYYEMNHSKRFYDILLTWMPDYKSIQKPYKKFQFPRFVD